MSRLVSPVWVPNTNVRVVIMRGCAAKDKLHDARERVVVFDVPHGGSSVACVAARTTSGATREGSRAGEGRA